MPHTRKKLTAEHQKNLIALAKLGPLVTEADAASILAIDPPAVRAWVKTPTGKKKWAQARAHGRAELVKVIRRLALEGSPQAQKLLVSLATLDNETAPIEDQRIPAQTVRELVGRGPTAIAHRVRAGDMIPTATDKAYRIADLIGLLPNLWERLSKARDTIARLERQTNETHADKAEAERLLALERLRRRRRENHLAEGRLIDAAAVQERIDRLGEVIRQRATDVFEELILKLSLPDPAAERMRAGRRALLNGIADAMQAHEGERSAGGQGEASARTAGAA